jgi:hypothetical protein
VAGLLGWQTPCSTNLEVRACDLEAVRMFLASRQENLTNRIVGQTISHYHLVEKLGGRVNLLSIRPLFCVLAWRLGEALIAAGTKEAK